MLITANFDSGLLQAMFLSEMDDMLLAASHDLNKLHLPLKLKIAAGAETYQSIFRQGSVHCRRRFNGN